MVQTLPSPSSPAASKVVPKKPQQKNEEEEEEEDDDDFEEEEDEDDEEDEEDEEEKDDRRKRMDKLKSNISAPDARKIVPIKEPVTEMDRLVVALLKKAEENDFYRLFSLSAENGADITIGEISKKRRDITKKMHPDNYPGDKAAQELASKKLSQVNEVFANVFRQKSSRELYDVLCVYRKEYQRLISMNLEDRTIQLGANNLFVLRSKIKKANMPRQLLAEIDEALRIINQLRNITPENK